MERKLERETQTVKIAQRSAQTGREAATQMERPGVIIDTSEDRWAAGCHMGGGGCTCAARKGEVASFLAKTTLPILLASANLA